MKKFSLLFSLSLIVALSSCNSNDDDDGNDIINEIPVEAVIKNDVDATNLVRGVLKAVSLGSGGSFIIESLSEATVSFEGEDTANGPLVSLFDVQPNNTYVTGQWDRHTGVVARANEAIEQISVLVDSVRANAATGKPLSTAGKNQALGGAYFARGLAYFYLVQFYGEAPLYTTTANASGGSRASIAALYAQIESDLKKAEELLPESTGSKTYPNKYAADAILSKVYLTWATVASSPDQANTPVAGDAGKLANAVTYANKVINSGQYELESDFIKTQAGRNNKFGREHILNFSYVLGESGPNDGGNHQSHCAFSYGFDADPNTQPTHIGPASYDLYTKWDNDNPHNAFDQRREFSYTSRLAKPKSGATPAQDSVYVFDPSTGWLPFFGKGIDRSYYEGPLVGPTERDLDRLEIRLAEVLLIKAEALIESDQNLTEAKNLINQVRRRAYQVGEYANGSNTLTAADIEVTANDQAGLRAALRQERSNELVYEQKRWLDLIRWHNLVETVLKVESFTEYTGTYEQGTFFAKVQKHLKARVAAVKANPTKFYRIPVPETALAANPNLTQNPGY
ncbi:MAG: RagB/SusD family nutrient uptake outer membrane protein [Tannerella sp.]|nr:RagB/SusD family nutrient uptake outer membrane protein [Tannerella sp.]